MTDLSTLRPSGDEDDERTTIVERTGPPVDDDERTTIVDRTEPLVDDERTTLVERTAPPHDDDDERTTIVDRAGGGSDDNETVLVSRSAEAGAAASADHSETIIVARTDETADRPPVKSRSKPAAGRRGRRRITLPPVEPGFGAEPVDAVGPNAVSSYAPREISAAPVPGPTVPLGADATRAPAPSMPSVGRRSRRIGMVAVGGFALACVVSVVGLVTIAVTLLG
jgi:hypothetical protein